MSSADLEVVREYTHSTDPRIKGNALSALLALRTPAALKLFTQTVARESDPEILRRAVRSLETLNAEEIRAVAETWSSAADDPETYYTLARLQGHQPQETPEPTGSILQRLRRAWRTRHLPAALTDRRFKWPWAGRTLVVGVLAALALAFALHSSGATEEERWLSLFVLPVTTGLLAAVVALATTRSFYRTRDHFDKVTGLSTELGRTAVGALASCIVLVPTAMVVAEEFEFADLIPCLFWSALLGVGTALAARRGAALGKLHVRPSSRETPADPAEYRWRATFAGWLLATATATVLCLVLLALDDAVISEATPYWWFLAVTSAVPIAWCFASLEVPWIAPPSSRRSLRVSRAVTLLVGLVPLLIWVDLGREVAQLKAPPSISPSPKQHPLSAPVSRFRFQLEQVSRVTIEAGVDARRDMVLHLSLVGRPGTEQTIDSGSYGAETYDGILESGNYEIRIEPYTVIGPDRAGELGLARTIREQLDLGQTPGSLSETEDLGSTEFGALSLAADALREENQITLGASQLEAGDTVLVTPPKGGGQRTIDLEIPVDAALVHLRAQPIRRLDSGTLGTMPSLILTRLDDAGEKIEDLGSADDLDMTRVLEQGRYRVDLGLNAVALTIDAHRARPFGDEPPRAPGQGELCFATTRLPAIQAFVVDDEPVWLEATDLAGRDIVLEVYGDDETRVDRADDPETLTIYEAGSYLAEIDLYTRSRDVLSRTVDQPSDAQRAPTTLCLGPADGSQRALDSDLLPPPPAY